MGAAAADGFCPRHGECYHNGIRQLFAPALSTACAQYDLLGADAISRSSAAQATLLALLFTVTSAAEPKAAAPATGPSKGHKRRNDRGDRRDDSSKRPHSGSEPMFNISHLERLNAILNRKHK